MVSKLHLKLAIDFIPIPIVSVTMTGNATNPRPPRHLWLAAIFCLALSIELPAQQQRPTDLIDRALALPPEFAAHALLLLLSGSRISDPTSRIELAEEAHRIARLAQLPHPHFIIGLPADSRSRFAFAPNGLDALSLQLQAVEAILPLAPARALQMFLASTPAPTSPTPCPRPLIPDPSAFYRTAALIYRGAFTPADRKREIDLQFLTTILTTVRSPSQLDPSLQLILQLDLPPTYRAQLLNQLAGILEILPGDDRAFSANEHLLIPPASPALSASPSFLPALRAYILRHTNQPRCLDNVPPSGRAPLAIRQFNSLVQNLDPEATRFKPIQADELRPAAPLSRFTNEFAWRSPRGKQLLAHLQWLTHGNRVRNGQSQPWTPAERTSATWRLRYAETLKLVESWPASEEPSAEDHLFVVSESFQRLAQLAPDDAHRDIVISHHLHFLEQNYSSAPSYNAWYSAARPLLDHHAPQLLRSANPVLSLFAELTASKQ